MRVKTDKKRNEIIMIAGTLFLEHGYGAVSMATIAAAVGGSKGTLYGYFASKEELFEAVVVKAGEQRWAEFIAFPERLGSIDETLKELGRRYLRFLLSKEIMSINRLVIAEASRFPELGRIFYDNGPKSVIGVIAATLGSAMDHGELVRSEPTAEAWRFKALCETRLFEQCLWGIRSTASENEIMQNVEPACDMFLARLRA
ncbi:TetR/AcrR family transcriptional regulator [Rhizobium pusense]|uniref:TetR/AcrR family transcriptional regulator n=1 Tax=Agrobacterium pusense TaxID=648995 RepID=UPI001FCDD98F|nr:TetR/AcrR family transcriptional regulator [Agrobacterium pusense]MCJ2877418.1 TetR/AcrR family transcriptional regulator [Agrobacterium pusense]